MGGTGTETGLCLAKGDVWVEVSYKICVGHGTAEMVTGLPIDVVDYKSGMVNEDELKVALPGSYPPSLLTHSPVIFQLHTIPTWTTLPTAPVQPPMPHLHTCFLIPELAGTPWFPGPMVGLRSTKLSKDYTHGGWQH